LLISSILVFIGKINVTFVPREYYDSN
jgi:hypothetical protein